MRMKNVLIVENSNNSLSLNESTQTDGKPQNRLGGIFTEFDKKNRNERIYTADRFIPCLNELNERISGLGAVYGEFDHPDVFDTSLQRASHIITNIGFVKEDNNVQGEIRLLSTKWGKEAKALVEDQMPIFVSSRAAGITESDGTVTLKKLFTYDIVADPGFGSAKMSNINESMGFKSDNNTNFRIYEIDDETKINELFTMNNNDMVTKSQLTEYSKYLVEEIGTTKKKVNKAIKEGKLDNQKMEELLHTYDKLQEDYGKMVKYLDYVAEKLQVAVNENKDLKTTTDKLIKHNDYLAENLEKNINYSEYIAENVDKNIKYSEYIAENVDKGIKYSEYIAENVDKNIKYSEYIAENVDKSIKYSEYIAENLESNIKYAEYIAEHVDNNIQYSEYLAENLEGNIAYAEYIAENLDDSIAYTDYIAENLDKSIGWSKGLVSKLNERAINENVEGEEGENLPMPPFEEMEEDEMPIEGDVEGVEGEELEGDVEGIEGEELEGEDEAIEGDVEAQVDDLEARVDAIEAEVGIDDGEVEGEDLDGEIEGEGEELPIDVEGEELEGEDLEGEDVEGEVEEMMGENLTNQIDKLIEEAKKRNVSESNDNHFLKFLNKSQVDSFNSLTADERENVALYINEKKNYYSQSDVLRLMKESLEENRTESLDEKLISALPEDLQPVWESLTDGDKKSVLSSARLYPNLDNADAMEHFWLTRKQLKKTVSTKTLVSESSLIVEDKLSEGEMTSIMERFKGIK